MTETVTRQLPADPVSGHIAEIAGRSSAWLEELAESIPAYGHAAARAACYILTGYWTAEAMAGHDVPSSPKFSAVARHVSRALNAAGNRDHLSSVNPTLRLLSEILLSSQGLTAEPLRKLLAQSASVLRRRDPVLEADPSLLDKRILLYCAGVLPEPPAPRHDKVMLLLRDFQLAAPAPEIDTLVLQLECLTGWGTRIADPEIIQPWVAEMVAGLAVHRLGKHDLLAATRLLRLLEYLSGSCAITKRNDLHSYICAQQQAHGPFGWYGPEAAALNKRSPASLADIEFYLPATVDCLRTLAESYVHDWRLFSAVPLYAGDP